MASPTLIPCGGAEYREMATILLAVAREIGMDTHVIRLTSDGFEVPQALLDAWDPQPRPTSPALEPEVEAPKRRGRPPGSANKVQQTPEA